jgi:hypothetical protein
VQDAQNPFLYVLIFIYCSDAAPADNRLLANADLETPNYWTTGQSKNLAFTGGGLTTRGCSKIAHGTQSVRNPQPAALNLKL